MTTQEAYDQIQAFFSATGASLSMDANSQCYYRHPDNSAVRCAVGCLIPDNLYDQSFEGDAVGAIIADSDPIAQLFGGIVAFLGDVQIAHDESKDVVAFLDRLESVADDHGV